MCAAVGAAGAGPRPGVQSPRSVVGVPKLGPPAGAGGRSQRQAATAAESATAFRFSPPVPPAAVVCDLALEA